MPDNKIVNLPNIYINGMIGLNVEDFFEKAKTTAIVDVRSPKEFADGHIPGAANIALFSDEERKIVGTLYKQQGKEAAVLKGLDLVGVKLSGFVRQAKKIATNGQVLIYCWRGGMRSHNMAWLFETAGIKVFVLNGGYKAYRGFIRDALASNSNFIILGGKTGSGKSEILKILKKKGEQVVDLEGIAHHKGSAFGDLGQESQPSTEQFENELYKAWAQLDPSKITWLEDESRAIGKVSIPEPFFFIMRDQPVIFIDVPKSGREDRLVKEYGCFAGEVLNNSIDRISKRLGGLNAKQAKQAIEEGDFKTAASVLLIYYDKAYLKGLSNRDQKKVFTLETADAIPEKNAQQVLNFFSTNQIYW